ncbi:MAG: hypothetical protein GX621_05795, partial [Pirellulaceae bacterium]|nr:hypothetical protein [Pirellulaceae bacterium]
MLVRTILAALSFGVAAAAWADSPSGDVPERTTMQWRSVGAGDAPASPVAATVPADAPATAGRVDPTPAPPEESAGVALPRDHGQVWREYDISEYTLRVTSTERPEQAVVDWILRETGYEAWHGEPLAILSCSPRKLHAYHTPDMQAVVAGIVDRFVGSQAESRAFSLRIV